MPKPQHTPPPAEPSQRRVRPLDAAGLFLRGVAMGAADIVPGVSGGTIALVTGIYERFIDALRSLSFSFLKPLARGDAPATARAVLAMRWEVLVPLGLGVVIAVLTMSGIITHQMETRPGPTYAFFFGLILASSWVPFAMMRSRGWRHAVAAVAACAAALVLVGLQPPAPPMQRVSAPGEQHELVFYAGKPRSIQHLEAIRLAAVAEAGPGARLYVYDPAGVATADPEIRSLADDEALRGFLERNPPMVVLADKPASLAWLFVCGVIAISAMVLPGVSGSFLLLFLGQYHAVIAAISRTKDWMLALLGRQPGPLEAVGGRTITDDLLLLGVFNLGVLLGLMVFSRAVSWLLRRYHDVTMAALTGLMLGALRQPWRVMTDDAERLGASAWTPMLIALAVGAVLVTALHQTDRRMRRARKA
jgi:putative membrane protein